MSFFKAVGCTFHPVRSARLIKDLGEGRSRFEASLERALVSRLSGTYIKAYAKAYEEAYSRGVSEGRRILIASLREAGIAVPKGVE